MKFLVIKNHILYPGSNGLKYHIFDSVDFNADTPDQLEELKREYALGKFETVDNQNPKDFDEYVLSRLRNIELHDGRLLTTITIFDHCISNIFYGFIPVEDLVNFD